MPSATNVTQPLPEWIPSQTNLFDANGNFNFTELVDPATPQRFFRIQLP